jgi:hypothetical protein
MARDRNTFAKRQRETGKKQKAQEKLARRRKKKDFSGDSGDAGQESRPAIVQEPGDPAGQ